MSARTQVLARRYFEEVLNGRDLAAVDQIVGSEFALYAPPSLFCRPRRSSAVRRS